MKEYGGLRGRHEECREARRGWGQSVWRLVLQDIREGIGKGFIRAVSPDCLPCPECPLGKRHKNINHINYTRIVSVIVDNRPPSFRGLRKSMLSMQPSDAVFLIGRRHFLMLSMNQRPRLFLSCGFSIHSGFRVICKIGKNGEEGRPAS